LARAVVEAGFGAALADAYPRRSGFLRTCRHEVAALSVYHSASCRQSAETDPKFWR
jgi:hypothetical protein